MSTPLTTASSDLAPISPDWTIAELVDWLADDSRQHDPGLQHPLSLIERALTAEPWSGVPSTVALIRSISAAAHTRGSVTVAELLLPSPMELSLVA